MPGVQLYVAVVPVHVMGFSTGAVGLLTGGGGGGGGMIGPLVWQPSATPTGFCLHPLEQAGEVGLPPPLPLQVYNTPPLAGQYFPETYAPFGWYESFMIVEQGLVVVVVPLTVQHTELRS